MQYELFTPTHIERVWSDAFFETNQSAITFHRADKQSYAIILSTPKIKFNNEKLSLVISCSLPSEISISVRDGDGLESRRINLLPFYLNGEFAVPLDIFFDGGGESFDKVLLYVDGEWTLSGLVIREGYQKLKLKIMLFSGIGDCLRAISRNRSLDSYISKYPCDVYWSYAGHGLQDSGWSKLLQEFVFGRVKNFHYVSPEEFDEVDAFRLFNGYSGKALFSHFFKNEKQGINIELTPLEQSEIDGIGSKDEFKIGIQLAGNDPKKTLSTTMLTELFELIFEKIPHSKIFIIDSPTRHVDPALLIDTRVVDLAKNANLAKNIHLIQKMNLWISPDSFSKYVANWSNIRQLILCCRLPYIEPREMLINAFQVTGLLFNSKVSILGIDFNNDLQIHSCVDDVSEISAADIVQRIVYE